MTLHSKMKRTVLGSIALGAALFLLAPKAAQAVEPPRENVALAQEQYTAGRESFRASLFPRALEQFERARSLAPSPNTSLYIARTLRELGRLSEAVEQYRETLREADQRGGKYETTLEAAYVELRDLKTRIERDEQATAASAPAIKGPPPSSATVTTPAPPAPARAPTATPPTAVSSSTTTPDTIAHGPTMLTWVSGGIAVVGVASFGALYALAGDRYSYLENNCTRARDAACDSARTTGKTEEVVAISALGVGAVAAAVAVMSLVISASSQVKTPRATGAARNKPKTAPPWIVAF